MGYATGAHSSFLIDFQPARLAGGGRPQVAARLGPRGRPQQDLYPKQ